MLCPYPVCQTEVDVMSISGLPNLGRRYVRIWCVCNMLRRSFSKLLLGAMHTGCGVHLRKVAFRYGLLEPRIMHAGCRVHLRKVAFDDAAGAKEQCMLDAGCARGERLLTLRGVEERCIRNASALTESGFW